MIRMLLPIISLGCFAIPLVACKKTVEETKQETRVIYHPELSQRERRALKWEEFSINLDVPINFKRDYYGSYSMTSKMMLKDENETIFFSFDGFTEDEVAEYKYYYGDDLSAEVVSMSNAEFMLRFAVDKRKKNLYNPQVSRISKSENSRGLKLYSQSIYGKESSYNDELFIYYITVSNFDKTILLQAIFSITNLKFVFTDVRDIFSSVYINK